MSETINFLYEAFNLYYNKGMEALKKRDISSTKTNLVKAAETLIKLAKTSKGNLKKARVERAERILMKVKELENKPMQKPAVNKEAHENSIDMGEKIIKQTNIPDIKFDDVAGLEDVKRLIKTNVILPFMHKELYKTFDKKVGGGILMYGPPGTGKTLIAKAIANEIGGTFFSIKCSDIISKWVGDSEKNIKDLFKEARKHEVSVIFFDEFEALSPKRGSNSTVMNRVVPELLSQIQGFDTHDDQMLVLLAATNCPWDIDDAMLRPGRFDNLIYIPLPDFKARKKIINSKLSKLPLCKSLDIEQMVALTEGYSGADLVGLIENIKITPLLDSIDSGIVHEISNKHVLEHIEKTKPSVNKKLMDRFKKYKETRI